ncbi:hypothetical protein HDV05_007253 [Chytridiales sp. JEL 0842]|nr:hypothetical protein HDV05_007253 [Chytridiales sp. JEL 0842]
MIRKVKCDGVQPSCQQCLNHSLICTYSRESRKRGPKQGRDSSSAQSSPKVPGSKKAKLSSEQAAHSGGEVGRNASSSTSSSNGGLSHGNPLFGHNMAGSSGYMYEMGSVTAGVGVSAGFDSGFNASPSTFNFEAGFMADADVWAIIDRDFDNILGGASSTVTSKDGFGNPPPPMSLSDMPNPFGFAFDGRPSPPAENTLNPTNPLSSNSSSSTYSSSPVVNPLPPSGITVLSPSPTMSVVNGIKSQSHSPVPTIQSSKSTAHPHYFHRPKTKRSLGTTVTVQDDSGANHEIPQEAVDDLLDLYFMYANPILAHIVHEKHFRATLNTQSPLLLCSMYAVAARYSKHPAIAKGRKEMYSAGDVFYSKSRILVSKAIDVPSLDTIAALVMLVTYASGSGRASASWMYSGLAIRMCQSLKLDLDPDFPEVQELFGKLNYFEKEQRRRLWWCCFIMDRYTASAADRSMLIMEKDSRVFPPLDVYKWLNLDPLDQEPPEDSVDGHSAWHLTVLSSTGLFQPSTGTMSGHIFHHYIMIARIYGRVMEYSSLFKNPTPSIPSAALIAMSDAELRLAQIETALTEWVQSLPNWMRTPTKSYSHVWSHVDPVTGAYNPAPWECAFLHMLYNTAVVLLHRPKMMVHLQSGEVLAGLDSALTSSGGALSGIQNRHFVASREAANRAADLLELIMEINPDFYWFTPFVAFCVFQTSLVHVVAAQTMAGDIAAVNAACARVQTHLKALYLISKFWLQGVRLAKLLQDLFNTIKPSKTIQDVLPSATSSAAPSPLTGLTPVTSTSNLSCASPPLPNLSQATVAPTVSSAASFTPPPSSIQPTSSVPTTLTHHSSSSSSDSPILPLLVDNFGTGSPTTASILGSRSGGVDSIKQEMEAGKAGSI